MKASELATVMVKILVFVLCVAIETASLEMFLQEPEEIASFSGDPVTLRCQINLEALAENTHQVIVAWKQDDALLINSSSTSSSSSSKGLSITGNSSIGEYHLAIASTSKANSGSYTCDLYMFVMVRISGGGVHNVTVLVGETDSASLTVLPDVQPLCSYEPFLEDSDEPVVLTGTFMSFICSMSDVNFFELHWQLESFPSAINMDDDFEGGAMKKVGFNTTTLLYNRTVTPLDKGDIFKCEMRSSDFPTLTRNCALPPLDVLYKPYVNIVPLSNFSHIHVGDDVSFFCSVDASPREHEMEWIVTPPQNIAFHGHQIEIHHASSLENFINLTCQASNDIGVTSTSILVHLRPVYKPLVYISMVTSSLDNRSEDGVRFRCNIDASPSEVTIRWVVEPHQYVRIRMNGREMTLSSLVTEFIYIDVSCLVGNRVGSATAHAFIYLPPASPAEQSTISPYGNTPTSANTTEDASTPNHLVNPHRPSATLETSVLNTTSVAPYLNNSILNPDVVESLPSSPFEERFHEPYFHEATIDSPLTEPRIMTTTVTIITEKYLSASTTDIPVASPGNIFKLNNYIISGAAAGGILLVGTMVATALCFSRMKMNKALRRNSGCTRVIYHPDDQSLILPFSQSRQAPDNSYEFLANKPSTSGQRREIPFSYN